jgi:hypothetical protein
MRELDNANIKETSSLPDTAVVSLNRYKRNGSSLDSSNQEIRWVTGNQDYPLLIPDVVVKVSDEVGRCGNAAQIAFMVHY